MDYLKKYVFLTLVVLMPMLAMAQFDDGAATLTEVYESDVAFTAVKPDGKELTEAQKTALHGKIERIIAKNNAGTVSEHNAFGIKADIDILDKKSSAGLARNVTVLTAEVTLTAFNTEDGSIYYSNSVKLETDVVGDNKLAMDKLINSIKVTDPQFVRFVRTARKRIVQWYNDRGLQLPLRQQPEKPAVHDTVYVVDRDVYVDQIGESDNQPVSATVAATPTTPALNITISTGDIGFEVLSTQVDPTRKRFTITAKITNNSEWENQQRKFNKAFDQAGCQLGNLKVRENSDYVYEDNPKGIGVQRVFMVDGITPQITSLSYVDISIGRTQVTIKDMPVKDMQYKQ